MKATVYWLHLPTHNDIFSEGYVGVSVNPKKRFAKHIRAANEAKHENPHLLNAIIKSGNTIIQTAVAVGTEEYCYKIEAKLRPKREMGWNIAEGGDKPPVQNNVIWINNGKNHKRIKASELETYPGWFEGRVNLFSEEEKQRISKRVSGKNNPFYGKKHTEDEKRRGGIKPIGFVSHNGRRVKFRGVEYPSLQQASIATKVSTYYIQKELGVQ